MSAKEPVSLAGRLAVGKVRIEVRTQRPRSHAQIFPLSTHPHSALPLACLVLTMAAGGVCGVGRVAEPS